MWQTGVLLTSLPDAPGVLEPEPLADAKHPIRKVTRQVAFEGAWDSVRAAKVGALFDGMAKEWAERRTDPVRQATVLDAVTRGEANPTGSWLECGSGTGFNTPMLADRIPRLIALDLAKEMLLHSPPEAAPRVQGDSSILPFADSTFDAVLLVNMLLFPVELDRVLSPGGRIIWVNTHGDRTPIHLPARDVMRALPGEWIGHTARAGAGFWLSARRAREIGKSSA